MSARPWTAGPWRWECCPKRKSMQLCGGKPTYDLTVMDFVRVGMNGAGARVIDTSETPLKILVSALQFAQTQEGRAHHADWFKVLRHPDLDLIAAAPDLAEALIEMVSKYAGQVQNDGQYDAALDQARAALAKAGVK
jgi:hypothetical protein